MRIRRTKINRLYLSLVVLASAALAACGGGKSGNTPVTLVSVAVTPSSPGVAQGLTQQMAATGIYSDSSKKDLTNMVMWTSTATAVASINETSGLVTTSNQGSTTVTATSGSISGSTTLTVTPPIVQSIAITPNPATTGVGITAQLTATATYSNNSTANVTATATWTSAMQSIATIGGNTGLTSGASTGSTTITAAIGSVTATASLSVVTSTWIATTDFPRSESGGTETLLQNGNVLVMSSGLNSTSGDAWVYNPATATWGDTGLPVAILGGNTATLLPNGTVLVTGGSAPNSVDFGSISKAEIYDPAAGRGGTWTATANLPIELIAHTATLLSNGTVLVAGGLNSNVAPDQQQVFANSEIYDPAVGTWTPAGSLNTARYGHTATLLNNGTVLVTGGSSQGGSELSSAEIFDPASGTWTPTANLPTPVRGQTATLLPNGTVLVAGGSNSTGTTADAEIYDPASGTWTPTASLPMSIQGHTATLLLNGTVLVAGGESIDVSTGAGAATANAEIYDPATGTWTPTGNLLTPLQNQGATLLNNGTVLVVGPDSGAEIYY
jgi:N-acetylneuraminic acid mutarotase